MHNLCICVPVPWLEEATNFPTVSLQGCKIPKCHTGCYPQIKDKSFIVNCSDTLAARERQLVFETDHKAWNAGRERDAGKRPKQEIPGVPPDSLTHPFAGTDGILLSATFLKLIFQAVHSLGSAHQPAKM